MSQLGLDGLIGRFSNAWRGTHAGDSAGEVRSRKRPRTLLAVCVLMYVTAQAFAQTKLSPELRHATPGKPVDVIVQFTSDPAEQQISKVTGKGAALKQKLPAIRGAVFTSLPAEALAQLAQDPNVAYITPDRPVQGAST